MPADNPAEAAKLLLLDVSELATYTIKNQSQSAEARVETVSLVGSVLDRPLLRLRCV